jgi:hypothetical protein
MVDQPIDPDAPPTEEEIRDSERLRDALEKNEAHDGADLLRAVKSASAPAPLDAAALDAAVAQGLARPRARKGGVVIRVVFGAGAVAVAAAILAVVVRAPEPPRTVELVHTRSTQSLFTERFEARGGETARIDRIAIARASDLRENQFAKWGVRDRGRR